MKNAIVLFVFAAVSLTLLGECYAAEARTNSAATLLKRIASSPRQKVIFRSSTGATNHADCILVEEIHSVRQTDELKGAGRTRTRVALLADDGGERAIWSYWPPNFPLAYDFKVAAGPQGTIIVFAKNYSVGVFEHIETNDLSQPAIDALNPVPKYVDLEEMVGVEAFAPDDGVVMNALTRNLKIERVQYDGSWHITVRGKANKLYEIVQQGENWNLRKENTR